MAFTMTIAACGITNDDKPRALPNKDVPFGLLDQEPVNTSAGESSTTSLVKGTSRATIFLVYNNERLFETSTEVSSPGGVRQVIEALFDELDPAQLAEGLNTSIDASTRLLNVGGPDANGLVTLDVSQDISATIRERLRLALAQIVYTVTAVPGVRSVRFKIEGKLSDVPDETGAATSRPLTRADFAQFAPLSISPPGA